MLKTSVSIFFETRVFQSDQKQKLLSICAISMIPVVSLQVM